MNQYLPRNKHDHERVKRLKKFSREELLPLLPNLLEWVQDMNWPIADDVSKLLLNYPNEMVPLIKAVLATDDDVWKYWCLVSLVKQFPKETQMYYKNDLIKLVEEPTRGERDEELDIMAMEILQGIQ